MIFFADFLERGLRIFLFLLLIFFLAQINFLFNLRDMLEEVSAGEIFMALELGTRLSCQTAGILTLIILIPSSVAKIYSLRLSILVEKFFAAIIFFVIFVLHLASFPFYEQFRSNFNQMVFVGLNDDLFALFVTFVQEFYLPLKIFFALVLTFAAHKFFCRFMNFEIVKVKKFRIVVLIALTLFFGTLSKFGGGLTWETELNFENIGVTKNNLLNESMLDGFQAIYRGYVLQSRIASSSGLNFSAEQVKILAANLSGKNPDSDNLDYYLLHKAEGAKIKKPKHIFLIISESLANWALLEKYSDLHIADNLKILARDGAYCPTFLPNGGSTISAVTGIVTGFADANLYLTTLPETYEEIFSTSAAPQMFRLGYRTNFFYAGPASWEKISDFTTAQGFENFYSEGDIKNIFPNASGNVWGVDDKFLYAFAEKKIDFSEPSFNVLLNVSNHLPYTVNLAAENISVESENLSREFGHYKYADREIFNFIKKIQTAEPESLFVIVGDHADRYHPEKNPSDYERFCVPLIIYGNGVEKNLLAENSAGSQIDIMPTVIELIAPKDFEYYSVGQSLTKNIFGVNYALFITRSAIGNANVFPLHPEPIIPEKKIGEIDLTSLENYINAVRGISYRRAKFGKNLQTK